MPRLLMNLENQLIKLEVINEYKWLLRVRVDYENVIKHENWKEQFHVMCSNSYNV